MPKDNESTKWLYEQLSKRGYNVGKDAAEFDNLMRNNKASREWAYNTAKSNGLNVGKDMSEFDNLVAPKQDTTHQDGSHARQVADEYDRSGSSDTPQQPWKPTAQQRAVMTANLEGISRSAQRTMEDFNERMDNLQEYGKRFGGGQTVSGGLRFNPGTKKMERTYLTPTGDRTFNKGEADKVSREYREAVDTTVGGQIRRAQRRLEELQEKARQRQQEIHDKWEQEYKNNKAPLAAVLAADTYVPSFDSDQTYRALQVAIRQTQEQLKTLQEQQDRDNGVDVGFWRGFGRAAGDIRSWDFGIGDMKDALTMLRASDDKHGLPPTDQEKEANQEMLKAIHENQQAEAMYGGNASFWNRAGMMTGYMPSFMVDFALTGGGFEGINLATRAAGKAATKMLGKEAVKEMAEQGFKTYVKRNGLKGLGQEAANWTVKALGTTADELLIRAPLMTNTVQLGDTAADIIDRKLGDVEVDENGNYDFTNDKTWGSAVWQGEANSIIENYSEMFGTHLPEVASLENLGRLANVIGAKRLSGMLTRANAGALGGITDTTRRIFGQMGVSDYLGEVSEEYYGQLWRTMLNLDDAYQQNADGTRTNLFATGQFHGDIWGGMALSMGLMGAGKATLSGANYLAMKHDVNKADARAGELLTPEIWEPLRSTIDMATNDNVGDVAETIINDKELTNEEKAAVMNYMERSLYLRGANLSELVNSRGGVQDERKQQANDSYIDGYNAQSGEEMQDARNMYELQRQKAEQALSPEMLAEIDADPIGALQDLVDDSEAGQTAIDYINAKQVYDGMIQRVRDDIDSRIDQSNAMIDSRVNRASGMIQGATMKVQNDDGKDRRVYVLDGNLATLPDGAGIDHENSDGSIIIRDADTGAIEMVSPDAIFSVEQPIDPETEKMTAAEAIRQQFAAEAAGRIDGVVAFNPGDTYTLTDENGQAVQIQIMANQDGLVDNGDGTVNVSSDGGQTIVPMSKEDIQAMVDATNRARVARLEEERGTIRTQQPTYSLNEEITITDENGNTVRGSITADANEDGQYEVYTEAPINGRKVNLFTAEELDRLRAVSDENFQQNGEGAMENGNNGAENIPQNGNIEPQNIPAPTETLQVDGETLQENLQAGTDGASALERIPKDEQGQPLYEQADPETAWDAIVEQTEGDEAMAQSVADSMVADKEAELKKIEKVKPKTGTTIAEKIAAERERKNAVEQAKANLALWQKIAQTSQRRKQAALAEQSKAAEEAARLRRAEEEKLRAEREEAERIRREALNGVPDFVEDTPQDARARGFRRVNGNKVDRQQAIPTRQGNEVQVKFDDNNIPTGHVSLIDASQLQPSHINGQRNPLHFIDEAQPKERNDEASIMSARKIAANIRPEEITSSVTAYTGAPTVNTRGEVIQGNNRSAALREMWAEHPEQATKYKQYLTEHAADFGLAPEDVEAMQQPVLVNMLDVTDDDAITLGQFVAQDTESGGTERIKPKNIVQKMGGDMRSFAGRLLASPDEEMSFAELIDRNGLGVLKWMQQKGYITPTQYKSAFDSKDNLTAEAKNDLKGVMYQSIFQNGNTHLEEMFNALPSKAQKAILATAYRDYDSPNAERMNAEIQNSISAYYALSQDPAFAGAKNNKEARIAAESWKRQLAFDDVTGESYLPAEKYSNFALLLATMYKGQTQTFIQNTFKNIFDLVQGTQEATLFEEPDSTPRTLVEAINETLSNLSEDLLLNGNFIYNGQRRNNVLAGSGTTGQPGGQGSDGSATSGGRAEDGTGTATNRGRAVQNDTERGGQGDLRYSSGRQPDNLPKEAVSEKVTPIGESDFGFVYDQFRGDAEGAIRQLIKMQDGEALGALHHKDIGDIDLVWGKAGTKKSDGYGLAKLVKFHPEVLDNLQDILDGMSVTKRSKNRIQLEDANYQAAVRLTWNGEEKIWLLTAFKKKETPEPTNSRTDVDSNLNGKSDDTATRQSSDVSVHKDTDKSAVTQTIGEKVAKAEEETDTNPTEAQKEAGNFRDVLNSYAPEKMSIEEFLRQASDETLDTIQEEYGNNTNITAAVLQEKWFRENAGNKTSRKEAGIAYTVTPAQYTNKRGKVLDMFLVTFAEPLSKEQQRAARELAKAEKGWYDRDKGGFMMRSEESARKLADTITGNEEAVSDAQPLSLADTRKLEEPVMRQVDVEGLMQEIHEKGEAKLSDHFVPQPEQKEENYTQKTERERQRMVNAVQKLAETLHLDNVDIVTDASTLQGRRAKAKGFYSRGTGRITIVIPNHTSVYDVEQTLLHEAVAHYGLRQLFGEHFDTFLDNVFQNADKDVRRRITELARERNWDFRTATEEYLASLAENTNFDNTDASWWQKIKELFLRMLHKIGFEDFSGVTLSDNELRYILWRSYENLAEPGRYRSILGEAADVAKQHELKVGNYAVVSSEDRNVADNDLYRDGAPEVHERVYARRRYEERVKRGMYQMQEALQDSMLGLREAMNAILRGEGKKKVNIEDVDGFENAYLGENRLSSVNKAEADAFAHLLFKPLLDEVAKLAPNEDARITLTDYMMAKHGLERNRVMSERDAQKDYEATQKAHPHSKKTLQDFIDEYRQKDYAGLTALTGTDNVADAEAEAQILVNDYEAAHDTAALWKRTKDVSNAILSKLYETGMMSKDTYDNVRSMYEYYIPLRGFDEKTSEEAYAYLNSKTSAFNAPIKTAKGRKSKADDPFAYLQNMAESAIMQGNRNKLVKQRFLNFVLNHPSDLASVSDLWVKYDKTVDEWKPVFPDNINEGDTAEEVERKMQEFEERMKLLAEQEPDLYKHGKDAVNIPYRVVEKRDLRQHQVVVKRGGRDYVITINGNPRVAQALNGQTNPDNDMSGAIGAILRAGERINRELSALYTTRNPDFVVSNFIRDMLYSNSMAWIKESPNYALRYHRNFAKVNPVRMKMLLAKYRNGTLDMNNETERMFHQFMMNGGETGYANIRDIERHKNDIRREIRKANGRIPIRKAWDWLSERFDEFNRGVENCARFAAFVTSREMGRTIDRSIYDAKEISVNFNKKGSGAKFMGTTGQTGLGNASAFLSGLGRSGFVFWNAAIQGTANFGRQTKRHPAKALTGLAVMFLLGAVVASLGYGDDDEDDKNSYWNLPEYVRRSNLLFRAGDQWISIPLPVEYRAVYGLGELMTSTLSGKEHFTDGELANKIARQVSQLLPLDFLEGGGDMKAFIPSAIKPFAEASLNTSWTGLPVYRDTPYNKEMPEWTKAYKNANRYLVDLSETLNEISGGDKYTKGWIDRIGIRINRDIEFRLNNPAQVEYVLEGYFGGIANTINRLTKMGETILGQQEFDSKNFLVLNRILKNGDERTEYKAVNNEYIRLKEEHDKLRTRLRNYERDTESGVFDFAEKIDFLYNSPEYARYEIFENYRPYIDDLYDMLKEANTYGDKEAVKDIEAQLNELKKMMIKEMNETRK